MFKSIVLIALAIASISAIEIHQPAYLKAYAAPTILKTPVYAKTIEYDAPAHYDFSYAVHDEHTGDIKSQQESRKGDQVHGSYSLIDADGYKRTVEYTADDHNGFNAVVHREPTNIKIPVAVHKVIATPIHKYVQPAVHYAAPQIKYTAPALHYAAPIAKIAAPVYHAPVYHAPAAYADAAHVSFSSDASNYHY